MACLSVHKPIVLSTHTLSPPFPPPPQPRQGTLSSFPKLLDELLPLRNDLSELHYTVQELRKAMNDVLLSDEDMEMMYLSNTNHPRPSSSSSSSSFQQNHLHRGKHQEHLQEVEMMFENYLMQLEWADTEIRSVVYPTHPPTHPPIDPSIHQSIHPRSSCSLLLLIHPPAHPPTPGKSNTPSATRKTRWKSSSISCGIASSASNSSWYVRTAPSTHPPTHPPTP